MTKKLPYLLLGLLVLILLISPFFIHVKVACLSQSGGCPVEIANQLYRLDGKNLFQVRNGAAGLLNKNLMVAAFAMQYKIPDTLEISVLIKKPTFAVLDKISGKLALVDKNGMIISIQTNSNLPTLVVANETFKVGSSISQNEFFDLQLIQGVWTMYQISSGEIQDENLVVVLPGSIKIILPQEGDKDVLLGEIRLVYGKVESPDTAGKYSEIDLRFKNPVLR